MRFGEVDQPVLGRTAPLSILVLGQSASKPPKAPLHGMAGASPIAGISPDSKNYLSLPVGLAVRRENVVLTDRDRGRHRITQKSWSKEPT
jgi:hypothetical protein